MIQRIKIIVKNILNIDARTIGLIAVLAVAVSVTYSSAKIIHKNYQLEQQITQLQQENMLKEQINKNQKLKNEYYTTDAFLDLAARRYFNKAAPGETLVLVPKDIAMSYTTPLPSPADTSNAPKEPSFINNWRLWLDFLSGKPIDTSS